MSILAADLAVNHLDERWALDPTIDFLNHGSFGACPRIVLDRQRELRDAMEADPVRFMTRTMQPLLDRSRRAVAGLIRADPADVVFVPNATAAVNAVLRSTTLGAGDTILVTDHGYNACTNVARQLAESRGVEIVTAAIPFPLASPDEAVDAILRAANDRVRIALIDHVTSPTALVLPIDRIAPALAERDIDVLIDGAHAPAMVPIDVNLPGVTWYAGNCHKWLCAPKGAGFLYARRDRQARILPPVISHGANSPRPANNRFHDAFDWPGTLDPTPWLCVPDALDFVSTLLPGGLDALRLQNRRLALHARDILCTTLEIAPPAPDAMLGSMAAVPLPDDPSPTPDLDRTTTATPTHTLACKLYDRYRIQVPAYYWPAHPRRLLRISAHAYNSPDQYHRLAAALRELLGDQARG